MNVFRCYKRNGILDAGVDVLDCKIGIIIADDLVKGETFVEQLENTLHCDARTCPQGLPKCTLESTAILSIIVPPHRNVMIVLYITWIVWAMMSVKKSREGGVRRYAALAQYDLVDAADWHTDVQG